MNLGDLHKVWETKTLKKPGEEEAKKILENVAKQVQPIMRKRKWRVKVLSEMCPKNPALLGLNIGGGVHVKLRLRRPNRDWDFLPFHDILDTMLHELCHNVHGPHNANFYKLWDELRKECEELISKGITGTGQGFDLSGRRLGGFSRQPPLSSLRRTALTAAEKRRQVGSLLPSGPKRVGGDSTIMAALSPVQAAAMAAERRFQDEIWCGSQFSEDCGDEESCNAALEDFVSVAQTTTSSRKDTTGSSHDVRSQKRSHGSITNLAIGSSDHQSKSSFVDLTEDCLASGPSLDHGAGFAKKSCKPRDAGTSQSKYPLNFSPSGSCSCPASTSTLDPVTKDAPKEADMWECGTCTLLNASLAPICELCSSTRPKDIGSSIWSCKFCTLENSVKSDKCLACGQWRYSYGPPIAAPAPNIGT